MITITDILGAQLESELQLGEWLAEYDAQFNAPLVRVAEAQALLGGEQIDNAERHFGRLRRLQRTIVGSRVPKLKEESDGYE
jgi:hypothetical protein